MAFSSASPADSPRDVLDAVGELTRKVRAAQRGAWFPLLVLACVNVVAIPVYRFAPHHVGPCRTAADGLAVCAGYIPAVLVYWPVALVVAYFLIARFYLQLARSRGVGTRIAPYVIAGVLLAAALAAASLWRATHPATPPAGSPTNLGHPHVTLLDFATPASALGLALLVLAWVEGNRLLAGFSGVYLAVVLVQAGRVIHSTSRWYFLPRLVVPAALLLLGSAGFGMLRRNGIAERR